MKKQQAVELDFMGCCCRGCLEKWHHIPKNRALTAAEQEYVVEVIMRWIEEHVNR